MTLPEAKPGGEEAAPPGAESEGRERATPPPSRASPEDVLAFEAAVARQARKREKLARVRQEATPLGRALASPGESHSTQSVPTAVLHSERSAETSAPLRPTRSSLIPSDFAEPPSREADEVKNRVEGKEERRWHAPPEDEIVLPELAAVVPFVLTAVKEINEEIEDAYSERKWVTPGFLLAQKLRAHPALASLNSWEAHAKVGEILAAHFPGDDPWVEALGDCESLDEPTEPVSDFVEGWDRVEWPRTRDLFRDACELALLYPLRPPPGTPEPYVKILSLAWYVARLRGGVFGLSARQAGEAAGLCHTSAARWLRIAQRDDLLALVSKGDSGPNARKAATYRFKPGAIETVQS